MVILHFAGHVTTSLKVLIQDFRKIMEPFTASSLRASEKNSLKVRRKTTQIMNKEKTSIKPFTRFGHLCGMCNNSSLMCQIGLCKHIGGIGVKWVT